MINFFSLGGGTDSVERNSKVLVDPHKSDGKNQSEVIHWHDRYICTVYCGSLLL